MSEGNQGSAALLAEPERRWRATLLLAWPLVLGAAPVLTAFGDIQLCGFRQVTGKPCPLCGGTHACAALIEGRLEDAWQANPGALIVLLVAAAHSLQLAVEAALGKPWPRSGLWRIDSRAWLLAGAFLLASWLTRLT